VEETGGPGENEIRTHNNVFSDYYKYFSYNAIRTERSNNMCQWLAVYNNPHIEIKTNVRHSFYSEHIILISSPINVNII
jgi:hypothetical protein